MNYPSSANIIDTQYSIIKEVCKKEFGWRVSLKDPWQ
jgi:tubulin polyglutamylase TTLL6/13